MGRTDVIQMVRCAMRLILADSIQEKGPETRDQASGIRNAGSSRWDGCSASATVHGRGQTLQEERLEEDQPRHPCICEVHVLTPTTEFVSRFRFETRLGSLPTFWVAILRKWWKRTLCVLQSTEDAVICHEQEQVMVDILTILRPASDRRPAEVRFEFSMTRMNILLIGNKPTRRQI